ncbi:DDE-type integrase/transposase/recombinase [Actinacidiphila glaucinigra]|uniref:transposase n=1 Tax=Actinacidiphila glaucinigra TaxID=235986 RepID=UPI00324BF399
MALPRHRHRHYLRRVVGWATADHLRTDLVAEALTAACRQRRPTRPVIFHSDRGCQYTSQQFAALADEFGIRLSVGRTGQCWDNALAESLFATIKRELLDTSAWPSRAAARTAIFDFIESCTTCTACTAASATAALPNTRRHTQPDHHTIGVRESGTSSTAGASPCGARRREPESMAASLPRYWWPLTDVSQVAGPQRLTRLGCPCVHEKVPPSPVVDAGHSQVVGRHMASHGRSG